MNNVDLSIAGDLMIVHLDSPSKKVIKQRIMWVLMRNIPTSHIVIFRSATDFLIVNKDEFNDSYLTFNSLEKDFKLASNMH